MFYDKRAIMTRTHSTAASHIPRVLGMAAKQNVFSRSAYLSERLRDGMRW